MLRAVLALRPTDVHPVFLDLFLMGRTPGPSEAIDKTMDRHATSKDNTMNKQTKTIDKTMSKQANTIDDTMLKPTPQTKHKQNQ